MRFEDFVDALWQAGWRPMADAQHTEVRKLWEELFPVIAELENELENQND